MRCGLLLGFLLAGVPYPAWPQTRILEPAQAIERDLAAHQTNQFEIAGKAGDYVRVTVEGRGALLRVAVFDPEGQSIFNQDRMGGSRDSICWAQVTERGGSYRIEVTSNESGRDLAHYAITLVESRPAQERDRVRAEAASALANGHTQQDAGNGDAALADFQQSSELAKLATDAALEAEARFQSAQALFIAGRPREAVPAYERAIGMWRASGDQSDEARGLVALGKLYGDTQQSAKAIDPLNRALAIAESIGDAAEQAEALRELGSAAGARSEYVKAQDLFQRGLSLAHQARDRHTAADILNMLGVLDQYTGKDKEALANYESALAIRRAISDRAGIAQSTTNLGVFHRNLGEAREAIRYYQDALAVRKQLPNSQGIANTLENLAVAQADLGNFEESITLGLQSADLFRKSNARRGEVFALINVGDVYSRLGDTTKALDNYARALDIAKAAGERRGQAIVLLSIGSIHLSRKEFAKAADADGEALEISQAAGNQREIALALLALADAANSQGDWSAALDRGQEALDAIRKIDDRREEGRALSLMGDALRHQNPSAGLETLQSALAIQQQLVDPDQEALTHSRMAHAEEQMGDLPGAREHALAALDLLESVRRNAPPEGPRVSFEASKRGFYLEAADILVRLDRQSPGAGFDSEAFQISERARARGLLDQLGQDGVGYGRDVSPALARETRSTLELIDAKASLLTRLLSSRSTASRAASVRSQLDALESKYGIERAQIRHGCPRCETLIDPQPLALDAIQGDLDHHSILLEYMLGPERGYLWVVTKTSLQLFDMPASSEIEKLVRQARAALTEPAETMGGESAGDVRARLASSERDFSRLAQVLARMLFPQGVELSGRRVLIAADGPLYYLPFQALLPASSEVLLIPSASGFAMLRRTGESGTQPRNSIAIFADPLYQAGSDQLPRLRLSREEALRIAAVAPGVKTIILGAHATRAAAEDASLGQYAILHFAAHALIDQERPELSGIALADGELRLPDIYNLSLHARLVVLSACRTALGASEEGEGPISLARAFLYAGAGGVVASLWDVDDRATEIFMTHFYEGLFGHGFSAAGALQFARQSVQSNPVWRHPYYWAGFVLIGDSPTLSSRRHGYDPSSSRAPARIP
ncbi:MAG TPA: CHAT domain-containing tetratricopeptide repeat protein [Bryobacteraceae bacterium]|nr:CHAT domain-containing tetratricopeptide repeat protein [Bryobacteraceae bacterium]